MNGRGRWIGLSLVASAAGSLALTVVYALGGQPQVEGVLLGVALGGLSIGLVLWGKELMPSGPFVEERDVVPSETVDRADAAEAFETGAEQLQRRSFLVKALAAAFAALGLAALFPIRSLGTRPGRSLFTTPWGEGVRVVGQDGVPVRPEDVAVNGVLTVFPEGHTDAADAQTLLIHLPPDVDPPGPDDYSFENYVAFSKVCTHAGCPVGLYQADTKELFCPCHQSAFAVLQGAEPTDGPATRPLPQLPIATDDAGFLVALGDFPEPIGPGFWSRGRA
ncbi:MAG: Rieske 2Fe-2S domain-containing protein [Actinomycetota bacterium]